MKSAFLLALSCATFLVASYAQDDGGDVIGRVGGRKPDVVRNIFAVVQMLADLVVPEAEMQHHLHGHLEAVETCVRKGDGFRVAYIRKFVADIPEAFLCILMTLGARNNRQQDMAAKCFVKKIVQFGKRHRVPKDQVQKIDDVIECLKDSFLM